MELRHLRYFVAVAEELHFRRAAERLHIAQPAVSEQIRNLERELGVQLLERTQRSVKLTPSGSALLEEARRMLRLADDAQRVARQAEAGVVSRLRIARPPDVLPLPVPRAMRRFAAIHSDVSVSCEQLEPRAAIDAVRRDLLDVAVVCLPAPVAGLTVTTVCEEAAVVALPDTHPGLGQAAFPIEQLDGTTPILLPRSANPSFHDAVMACARSAGITLAPSEVATPTVEQTLLAVVAGRAPAAPPASVAHRHTFPGLRFLPLAEPAPRCTVALVSAGDVSRIHAVRFIRLVAAFARPSGARERPALAHAA